MHTVTRIQVRHYLTRPHGYGASFAHNTDGRELARMQFYAIEVRCIPVSHIHTEPMIRENRFHAIDSASMIRRTS